MNQAANISRKGRGSSLQLGVGKEPPCFKKKKKKISVVYLIVSTVYLIASGLSVPLK